MGSTFSNIAIIIHECSKDNLRKKYESENYNKKIKIIKNNGQRYNIVSQLEVNIKE